MEKASASANSLMIHATTARVLRNLRLFFLFAQFLILVLSFSFPVHLNIGRVQHSGGASPYFLITACREATYLSLLHTGTGTGKSQNGLQPTTLTCTSWRLRAYFSIAISQRLTQFHYIGDLVGALFSELQTLEKWKKLGIKGSDVT